jgi:hypothetical protein
MEYKCKHCNKLYKSYKSLWNHNNKFHNGIYNHLDNHDNHLDNHNDYSKSGYEKNELVYKCRKCNKNFKYSQNRWRHEKSCNENQENINNIIDKMQKEIDLLKNKPSKTIIKNINQGTINKGPVYNFLNKIGNENINLLTEKEIEYIMDQELNCIVSLISLLNFNQEIPENHTFCTTALNDKYISTINTETLEIEKQRKKDFFDNLLWSGINKMKLLYDKLKSKKSKRALEYKKNIENLTDYLIVNDKGKKTFVELVNALTFNNRHLVQSTWLQLKNNQLPENKRPDIDLTEDDEKPELIKKSKILLKLSDSDSDSSSSDSEDENPNIKIVYKSNPYILENDKLFYININGSKGKQFGTYLNGKVYKSKQETNEFEI